MRPRNARQRFDREVPKRFAAAAICGYRTWMGDDVCCTGTIEHRVPVFVNETLRIRCKLRILRPIMPRKTPIPEHEREICLRFRIARESSRMKQSELARKVGVNVNTLSSWEHGNNPVPYVAGARIAKVTDTCQRWLATGSLPQKPYIEASPLLAETVPPSFPFSFIYQILLRPEIEELFKAIAASEGQKIEVIEPHSFRDWGMLLSTPIEGLQASCAHEFRRGHNISQALPLAELGDFRRRLHDLMNMFSPQQDAVEDWIRQRREEEDSEKRNLDLCVLTRLRDCIQSALEATEKKPLRPKK